MSQLTEDMYDLINIVERREQERSSSSGVSQSRIKYGVGQKAKIGLKRLARKVTGKKDDDEIKQYKKDKAYNRQQDKDVKAFGKPGKKMVFGKWRDTKKTKSYVPDRDRDHSPASGVKKRASFKKVLRHKSSYAKMR